MSEKHAGPDLDREWTKTEEVWWKILKAHLRRMPQGVELHARMGVLGIAPDGSRDAIHESRGDCNTVAVTEWDELALPRLNGRNSQL